MICYKAPAAHEIRAGELDMGVLRQDTYSTVEDAYLQPACIWLDLAATDLKCNADFPDTFPRMRHVSGTAIE